MDNELNPVPPALPASFLVRLIGALDKISAWSSANKKIVFVSLAILLIGLTAFWARYGFTLDFSRFLAGGWCPEAGDRFCSGDDIYELYESPDSHMCEDLFFEHCACGCNPRDGFNAECNECPAPEPCKPTYKSCDDEGVFQHYENCNGETVEICPNGCEWPSGQDARCKSAPEPCKPTYKSCDDEGVFQHYENCNGETVEICPNGCEWPSGEEARCRGGGYTPEPTPPPGSTPTPEPSGDCIKFQTVYNDFIPNICQSGDGGPYRAVIRVTDSGPSSNVSVLFNSYHNDESGCGATSGGGGPGTGIDGTSSFPNPHGSGEFTLTFDPSPWDCGRVQVDAAFRNAVMCPGDNSVFFAGIIDYGRDCGLVMITPTPPLGAPQESEEPPAPTPTPIPTLVCNQTVQSANINEVVTFTATGGTGSYGWVSTPDGSAPNNNQSTFNVQYPTDGQKTVTVTSGTQTATCGIVINSAALACSPSSQSRNVNEVAALSAVGGTGSYTWSAPSGAPASGVGSSFGVAYATPSGTTPYQVTVTSGSQTATCTVAVTALPTGLACSPSSQSVWMNQTANFTGTGGTGSYTWSAPSGTPVSGTGQNFSSQYGSSGTYTVTLTSGSETDTCTVAVVQPATPTPTPPVVILTPALSVSKSVRNITQSSIEATSVAASPGDTVEFILRVNSIGNSSVQGVRVTDTLPFALSYISGSTTVDGSSATDGIIAGGVYLGDLTPGRTVIIRFRAIVAGESSFSYGTTTLTNTVTVTSTNTPTVSNVAFVNVTRSQTGIYQLTIVKYGRNVTRGEYAESTSVSASPNDTIEFIVRVRPPSTVTQVINNVVVRDVIPSGISYIPNSTSVNSTLVGDNIVSSGGLSIGSLNPGQEAVIRFSGRVNPASTLPAGITTVLNTVYASATGVAEIMAQLPVIISNGSIAGISQVPTGSRESVVLALAVSLIVTMMYVTYTRTQLFKRHEVESIVREGRSDKDLLNFKK